MRTASHRPLSHSFALVVCALAACVLAACGRVGFGDGVAPKENGEPCADNAECIGTCIAGGCTDPAELNQPCDDDDVMDCAAGLRCVASACLLEDAGRCIDDAECVNQCIQNVCAPSSALGGACDDDADCADSLACLESVCTNRPSIPAPGRFQAPQSYAVASEVFGLAPGDYNGDGNLDVVVLRQGNLVPLLGAGDGTLVAGSETTTGTNATNFGVATINGDAELDAFYVEPAANSFAVHMGVGDGTFGNAIPTAIDPSVTAADVADIDDNGTVDFLVARDDNGTLQFYSGAGDGTFAARASTATGAVASDASSLTFGRLDADTHMDVVVTHRATDSVSVLLGAGDGTFAVSDTFLVGDEPEDAALADLNADGFLDVAVANRQSNSVSVRLGAGDGTFASPVSVSVGVGPVAIELVDLNGDSRSDMVTANGSSSGTSVAFGLGSGSFEAAFELPAGVVPRDLAVADVNADGFQDVISGNFLSRDVSVVFGDGRGGYDTAAFQFLPQDPFHLTVTDLNGDAAPDVVIPQYFGANSSIFLNDGSGAFPLGSTSPTTSRANRSLAVDLDADGNMDLLVASVDDSQLYFLRGNGAGGLAPAVLSGVARPLDIATGDVNGDSHLDVVLSQPTEGLLTVFVGDGTGALSLQGTVSGLREPREVALADVGGSAALDLLVATRLDGLQTLLGNGDGTFQSPLVAPLGFNAVELHVAELNGDSNLDVLVQINRRATVFLGAGDGNFTALSSFGDWGAANGSDLGDVDGNGILDFVIAGNPRVFLGQGDGTFVFESAYVAPTERVILSDANGDGSLDLLGVDRVSRRFFVLPQR